MDVSHVGNCEDFFEKLAPYTNQHDTDLVFIADGAIWNWVDTHCPRCTQILDYYHALGHLGEFASLVFKKKSQKEAWIEEQKDFLWNDQVERVMEAIDKQACKTQKQKDKQRVLMQYDQNNRDRMQYKTFTEKGLLIGSGAIESAHRTVIQKRPQLSGQRWAIIGVQQVFNLRVANMSGYWDKVIQRIDKPLAA